ncbi:unnamed protein product [Acanthosepion pharaonis]|uniref:Uncharacterized protein n=1 Tax=Acanthosepion pharaonis TaxID=158019 RepID=A0A812DL61_ACAPH|nr:unnamed protein product [Sepia pharaonis]
MPSPAALPERRLQRGEQIVQRRQLVIGHRGKHRRDPAVMRRRKLRKWLRPRSVSATIERRRSSGAGRDTSRPSASSCRDRRDVAVRHQQRLRQRAHGDPASMPLQRGQHVEARQRGVELFDEAASQPLLDRHRATQQPQQDTNVQPPAEFAVMLFP